MIYDLDQVASLELFVLRDTLVHALQMYRSGPRVVIVQLCLSLACLALQLPTWENPVQDMIDTFGSDPAAVPVLLQFLTLLPEEIDSNTRIPVTVRSRLSERIVAKIQDLYDYLLRMMNTVTELD